MSARVVRIEVTGGDIAAGEPCRSAACPIALAVARAIGDGRHVGVGPGYVVVGRGPAAVQADLPVEARSFVERFDLNRPVTPFAFDLELPTDEA